MRCLQLIRKKYVPKRVAKKKRVRSRKMSESIEISDDENIAKEKTMRNVTSSDIEHDEAMDATGQSDSDQSNSSNNGTSIDMDDGFECFDAPTDQEPSLNTHGIAINDDESSSHSLNSIEIPTMIQIENAANNLRDIGRRQSEYFFK